MEVRSHWSGRLVFILAAAGSAIGLGNIWKFPYITGQFGGGAFVLVYLLTIGLIGIPIFIAELYIGQKAQSNPVMAFEQLDRKGTPWRLTGLLGIVAAFIVLSFYSVVGGWILSYEWSAIIGEFSGKSDVAISDMLGELFASPGTMFFWHTVFMAITVLIVIGGIQGGIEKWSKILMPALLGLLGLLLFNSFFQSGFGKALDFLFTPDFSKLTKEGVQEAVGHSFFTLSLGLGAMITYGSYLRSDENLVRVAVTVALMDTAIALIAGLVIFTTVFTYDAEPSAGPGLMFAVLPTLFSKMTGGYFIAVGFFLLVAFAALTSAISLLEVVVTYVDERLSWPRVKTTLVMGAAIWLVGALSVLSFNVMADVHVVGKLTFFDFFDDLTTVFLLPIGGLFIALFFGWKIPRDGVARAIGMPADHLCTTGLVWTSRLLSPAGVFYVLMLKSGEWLEKIATF